MLIGMCAHYDPQTDPARLQAFFGVSAPASEFKPSVWPGYVGPFLRHSAQNQAEQSPVELLGGRFGLIPHWARDATIGRHTYNARAETVHEKPSFRDAWRRGQFCLIPADAIYEPDWRSGRAVPSRISRSDGLPMGIAGLWASWRNPEGGLTFSYSMLTINADQHPVMSQFHKPEDEKRMVVILPETQYSAWLTASPRDTASFLLPFPAEQLVAESSQPGLL